MRRKLVLLKKAHKNYVDWWLPHDIESGSLLAPIGFLTFLQYLLTMPTEIWWDRWLGDKIPKTEHSNLKIFILTMIISHHLGEIDLYKM